MTRILDIVFSAVGLLLLSPFCVLVLLLGYFDTGSPLFRQTRMGKNKKSFVLVKFRSMPVETQSTATHLVGEVKLSRFGQFLRASKIDELPQLVNVLRGDMSLVGPRPCLPDQTKLINERDKRGVFTVRPGITGLAQVNHIDMSQPERLAQVDQQMIKTMSVSTYLHLVVQTVLGKGSGDKLR